MSDCLIIGGGLIGLLTARELLAAGMQVQVVERGQTGREASWAGGGILSPLYPWRYVEPVSVLAQCSQQSYEALANTLLSDTGIDPEWTRSGMLLLDGEPDAARQWAEKYLVELQQVYGPEIREIEPATAGRFDSGIWLPGIAQVRNPRLMKALVADVRRRGGEIREFTVVKEIRHASGRIRGVETPEGFLAADRVILAAGAWSGRLLAGTGLDLPVKPVHGQMLLFHAEPGFLGRRTN